MENRSICGDEGNVMRDNITDAYVAGALNITALNYIPEGNAVLKQKSFLFLDG